MQAHPPCVGAAECGSGVGLAQSHAAAWVCFQEARPDAVVVRCSLQVRADARQSAELLARRHRAEADRAALAGGGRVVAAERLAHLAELRLLQGLPRRREAREQKFAKIRDSREECMRVARTLMLPLACRRMSRS